MITIEEMLQSNVHIGHSIKKWNPKMAPFIYAERNKTHIIDLLQTIFLLKKAYEFLYTYSKKNKSIDYNYYKYKKKI